MTTWMLALALMAGTDGANARDRLAAEPAPRHMAPDQIQPAMPGISTQWTYLGPEEASLTDLVVSPSDPDHLLATNYWGGPVQGLTLQTRTGGQYWTTELPLREVWGRIGFMPDGSSVVAGREGVYSQAPGASTWTHHPHPGTGATFEAWHLSGGGPDAPVWLAGELDDQMRVFRIDDLSSAWVDVTPAQLDTGHILGIAASATDPEVAAVAFKADFYAPVGTVVTSDGGTNWQENEASPGWLGAVNTFQLHGDRLFLGVTTGGGFNGLFVGEALGTTWAPIYSGGGSNYAVVDMASDADDPSRLWIATPDGVLASSDGGATWQQGSDDALRQVPTQVAYDANAQRLWVSLHWNGVWMSADDGESFERRSHRLGTMPSTHVTLHPEDPAQIALATQSETTGAWYFASSTDGGLQWASRFNQPAGSHGTRPFFDPGGLLYVAFGDGYAANVQRRAPGGDWQAVSWQGPGGAMAMVMGRVPGNVLVSSRSFSYVTYTHEAAVHRFDALTGLWTQVLEGVSDSAGFDQLLRVPMRPGVRLLAHETSPPGEGHGRLFGSDDDGRTWSPMQQGLPQWNNGAMCTGDDRLVMLVLEHDGRPGLYRSNDGGSTWVDTGWTATALQEMGSPFASIHCPEDGERVYLGDQRGNVWVSSDGGASFPARAADDGVWGQMEIRDIQSSTVGLYVASTNGLWVNTTLARQPPVPVGLEASLTSARMRSLARLAWQGGSARVEIRRNGAVVAETENTGTYVDAMLTPQLPPTLAWQVCNAGTQDCSEVVEP